MNGLRMQTKVIDANEVDDRGEVVIPIGHTATIGECVHIDKDHGPMYAILWDDDEQGQSMGWCIWSIPEILRDARFI